MFGWPRMLPKLSVLLLCFGSHAYGDDKMTTMTDDIAKLVDANRLEHLTDQVSKIFVDTMAGRTAPIESQKILFEAINENLAEAVVLFTGNQIEFLKLIESSDARVNMHQRTQIDAIRTKAPEYSDLIGLAFREAELHDAYLSQIQQLNQAFIAYGIVEIPTNDSLQEVFDTYRTLIGGLEFALGYVHFGASYDREKFWPDAEFHQGDYKYISLFRSSGSERVKNQIFVEHFDRQNLLNQVLLYAWVYDASFETFIASSEVPQELPPWINSQRLRQLHALVNGATMERFREMEANALYE